MDLEALLGPLVEGMGLELVEAGFDREGDRRILRVVVDREGGVDLDTIAAVSERVSRRLDVEDFGTGPYTLEVSSPGVECPLRKPTDFTRRVGERVKVRTSEPVEGARSHTGTLVAAGDREVTIATEAGERTVPYEEIASARTVFEWGTDKEKKKRSRK